MAKRHMPIRIDETPPVGKVTDAIPPVPVECTVVWGFLGEQHIDDAWAMAWTRTEVLVFWRTGPDGHVTCWIRSDQVKRRTPK